MGGWANFIRKGEVKETFFFSLPPFSEENSRFLFQGLWANLVDSLLSWLEPLNQSRPLILSFHPACWDRLEWPWKAIIWTDVSVSRWLPSTGPSQFLMPELQGEDVVGSAGRRLSGVDAAN